MKVPTATSGLGVSEQLAYVRKLLLQVGGGTLERGWPEEGEGLHDYAEESRDLKRLDERLQSVHASTNALLDVQLATKEMVRQLLESGRSSGMGAIHALKEGTLILKTPLLYAKEEVGNEVFLSLAELGVYGAGATEHEALRELKEELDELYEELMTSTDKSLGPRLRETKRFLASLSNHNA